LFFLEEEKASKLAHSYGAKSKGDWPTVHWHSNKVNYAQEQRISDKKRCNEEHF